MKKIIVFVILIAAAGLVGPKIIGSSANQKFEEFVAVANETPGYQVQILDSETSWFSSRATVNVGLDSMIFGDMAYDPSVQQLFSDISVDLDVTIQHGPFLTLNGLGLGLLAVKADVDDSLFRDYLVYPENQSLYTLVADLNIFGGMSYSDSIQGFELRELGTVSFSGWDGEGSISSNYFSYKGEMGSLTAEAGSEKFEMTSLVLDLEAEESLINILSSPFYDSYANFSIGAVAINAPNGDNATLKNIGVTATTEVTKGGRLMDVGVKYGAEEISVPGFNASDLVLDIELVNLEKEFLTALQNVSQSVTELEQLAELFNANILAQLKASPEFNINELSGKVDDNSFSGKMLIKLSGIKQLPIFIADPGFWLSKLTVDSHVEMDKAMAILIAESMLSSQQQAEATVNMLTAQGMITSNARNKLKVALTIDDSQLTINGNPMPLPY